MIRRILALGLLCPLSFGHDVWVVDASGQGDFLRVQAAIDAAHNGDTILVKAGTYNQLVFSGKGIQLVAENNQTVNIWRVTIGEPMDQQSVYIAGINSGQILGTGLPTNVLGHVLVEDCGKTSTTTSRKLEIRGRFQSVSIVGCASKGDEALCCTGENGEPALRNWYGSRDVFAYHSTFVGSQGGDGYSWTCTHGGDRGSGILMYGGFLRTQNIQASGGGPGSGCPYGGSGAPIQLYGAQHTPITAPFSRLTIPNVVREGELIQITVTGSPGTWVDLLRSSHQAVRDFGPQTGALLLAAPWTTTTLGQIPQNGVLSVPMLIADLPPGQEGEMTYFQAVLTDSAGPAYLSNPSGMVTLDVSF